jgi:hypothetical protein
MLLWLFSYYARLGLATEFRSEKISQNRIGMASSTEESAHSEAFRGLLKSQFRGSERKKMT